MEPPPPIRPKEIPIISNLLQMYSDTKPLAVTKVT